MSSPASYPYTAVHPQLGPAGMMPLLSLRLENGPQLLDVIALVDSGATANVVPYGIGLQLGGDWRRSIPLPSLTGNLSKWSAKALFLKATISPFPPLQLVFAWSQDPDCPVLLGQMNFFENFDVCFHRSQRYFEIQLKP